MPLLEVAGLSIDVAGERVIDELSFMVARGDRFGIVGEKGRDKMLVALALAGLLPRGSRLGGQVRYDGKELPAGEGAMAKLRGTRIGLVLSDPYGTVLPRKTIASQLAALIKRGRREAAPGIEVPRLLGEVGLTEKDGALRVADLAPEAAQRAAVALAIAGNPAMLIAHEPAAGLDLIAGRRIIDLIADVAGRHGLALVFISDNLRAVAAVCGRVMIVDGGRIVEAGKVSSVFGHPREPYTKRLIASAKPVIRTLARPPTGSVLLEVRGITRRYGRNVTALDDVSFSVGAMESVALIGPAGAGKSTLARIIGGLERADEGDLVFERTTYRGTPMPRALRREIALVFENPAESFDPRRTMGDSIGEALGLERSLVAATRKERIAEALFAVGLSTDLMGRRPQEFSTGQLQRFAIARALVTRPRLLVLDEPVKAVDVASRGEILALLTRMRADLGLTYLIVGDDPDSVGVIADRVLIMDQGKVVETGRPGELLHNPKHPVTQDIIAARLPQLSAVLAVER